MSSNLLSMLQKGLKALRKHVESHRNTILNKIKHKAVVPSEDEAWLDHEGNMVDKEWMLDLLERAKTPDGVFNELNDADKMLAEELRKLGEPGATVAGNWRKRGNFEKAPEKQKDPEVNSEDEVDGPRLKLDESKEPKSHGTTFSTIYNLRKRGL
ncbi:hypothetical protein FA15DRAFT_707319 [Coprinopsis marcescibilis]|uniref:Uncharacterized protein n=1 Tax=Coprinopsis marcescibilis TaxID=230819 RepID=A0A5C3KLV7_COPMA|nr:hypothetical protein FA15DRAFT_707319 [Coprinopsis marcescibilis]